MYWFSGEDGSVLYVGKAKDLSKRISQYRQGREAFSGPNKEVLLREAVGVTCQVLSSELEALLVEAELIHKYQPRLNILLKDDKSPIYVVITRDSFPRVLTARKREIDKGKISGDVYGPFQSAYMLGKVLRTIRPIFQWCNRAWQLKPGHENFRPCFYYHLDMCSGACMGMVGQTEYRESIARLRRFLRGHTQAVLRQLKKDIQEKAGQQQFEDAAVLRGQYEAIQQITDPAFRMDPDIALPRLRSAFGTQAMQLLQQILKKELSVAHDLHRIECYDVSNLQGKLATVSMVVFIDGVSDPSEYKIFHVRRHETPDDYAMLRQVLRRRQNHPDWGVPDLVLIDGGRGQLNAAKSVWQWPTPVAAITKRPDRLTLARPDGSFSMTPVSQLSVAGELVQQLRDEAHRFAKKHVHRRLAKRDFTQ